MWARALAWIVAGGLTAAVHLLELGFAALFTALLMALMLYVAVRGRLLRLFHQLHCVARLVP